MSSTSSEHLLVRLSTAGSVDDGKSTLIGRLLHDTGNVYEDHLAALQKTSDKMGEKNLALALLTDGLKAEREQGITIDVAYRYFSTPRRRFILADTPGHEQYTRNMATGASTADLSIILIDARNGVTTQTRRHAFIASLMGVPRLLVAINKMDLVDFSEKRFEEIRQDFVNFASKLEVKDIRFVPVAALLGDNVVNAGSNMPWYQGETVMQYLENVYTGSDRNLVDFRFPVQYVIRAGQDYRGYAGQIVSGVIRSGDEVVALPSMRKTTIKAIDTIKDGGTIEQVNEAHAPMSVTLRLSDEIDIPRGDMIARSHNLPALQSHFEAMLVWMSEQPMDPAKQYIIRHTTREAKVFIDQISYRLDVNTLSRIPAAPLTLNEIGRVVFHSAKLLCLDTYRKNRATGNFILVDPESFLTVAAGMAIDRVPEEKLGESDPHANLHKEPGLVSRKEREAKAGGPALTFWFTGLSGSGKSTIARALERRLFDAGVPVYRLDGDNLRSGLNSDLGFSKKDRTENIRRAAEVAHLFNEAGISVISAIISPFNRDREGAKKIIGEESFVEVFVDTPVEVCEKRDTHGLYARARAGQITDFTGVSSPYEAPLNPDVVVSTAEQSPEQIAESLLRQVAARAPRFAP